jgi:hypothetical protein
MRTRFGSAAIVAGVVVALVAGCASKNGGGTSVTVSTPSSAGAAADVTIAGCEKGSFDAPVAHLVVTNNSSTARSYVVKVAFDSPDGATQYDSAFASVSTLAPGQSSPNDAGSLKAIDKQFSCKVLSVTANPS